MSDKLTACGCPTCERVAREREPERVSALNRQFIGIVHREWSAADEANARLAAERESGVTIEQVLAAHRPKPGTPRRRLRRAGPFGLPQEGWDSA